MRILLGGSYELQALDSDPDLRDGGPIDRLLRLFTDTCSEPANFDLRPANANPAFANYFTNRLAYSYA